MKIFLLILFGFSILMIGGDIAAIYGSFLRHLLLPGYKIVSYIPFVGVGIYILTILLTKITKRRWVKSIAALIGIFFIGIVYYSPFWILDKYSHKIKIEKFYSRDVVTKFEKKFNTYVFQRSHSGEGSYFVVPLRDYDNSMNSFLLSQTIEISEQNTNSSSHNP